jgi:uncharacterized coiled-coil protein SlyX
MTTTDKQTISFAINSFEQRIAELDAQLASADEAIASYEMFKQSIIASKVDMQSQRAQMVVHLANLNDIDTRL